MRVASLSPPVAALLKHYEGQAKMPKKKFSQQLLAALASGVAPSDVPTPKPEAESERQEGASAANSEAEASTPSTPVTEEAANTPDESAAPAPTTVTEQPAPQVNDQSALVAHLKEELAEVRTKLEEANTAKAKLESDNARLSEGVPSLERIVRMSVKRLGIALGATVIGLDSLNGSALSEQFDRTNQEFEKRFQVGAVSKAEGQEQQASSGSKSSEGATLHGRRIGATTL